MFDLQSGKTKTLGEDLALKMNVENEKRKKLKNYGIHTKVMFGKREQDTDEGSTQINAMNDSQNKKPAYFFDKLKGMPHRFVWKIPSSKLYCVAPIPLAKRPSPPVDHIYMKLNVGKDVCEPDLASFYSLKNITTPLTFKLRYVLPFSIKGILEVKTVLEMLMDTF